MNNGKQSPTIKWAQRGSHASTNSDKHPYLFNRVNNPKCDKDVFINSCNDTFDKINANIKDRMDNNGKTTGIELTNINELRK